MAETDTTVLFHEMGLDQRLLKAIANLRWSKPMPIQEKAIPLILEGKDILARARTGSGKTGSFAVPLVQKLLVKKLKLEPATRVLVLAPSKELCRQTYQNFVQLTTSCSKCVRCVDVSAQTDLVSQRTVLLERPDIVVGTPARVLAHLQAGNLDIKTHLEVLVIDEADLIFSFGYTDDVYAILKYMPQIYQTILMSATLTPEILDLKRLALRNSVVLKLEEPIQPEQLSQYVIRCEEEDKFAVLCAMFKLKLLRGKCLMFVSSVDRCYLVKLFLEQFGIRACILNSELPVSSRTFIVTQFNEGRYEILIASEEKTSLEEQVRGKRKRSSKRKQDKEYGVCRGIDFQFVSNVINVDFPTTVQSYVHRVGRTARGDNQGTALSFVKAKEEKLLEAVEKEVGTLRPYQFKMNEIEGFRYRSKDALRAVTSIAIREARLKEIKAEMLTSEKLKAYFEENPRERKLLRHDKALHVIKHKPHLKNVPEYIVPPTLRKISSEKTRGRVNDDEDEVVAAGPCGNDVKMKKRKKKQQRFCDRKAKKQRNPLHSFKFEVE